MREILFRGKSILLKEFVYGFILQYEAGTFITDGMILSQIDPETAGQFTGLTDKNGKQIFEGDILRLCDATYPCEIYWSGIGWAIKRNDKRVDYNYGSSLVIDCEKMQVIGNIYDNPELL